MKKILFLLSIVAVTLTSCDKFLDVKPTGTLIPKTIEDYDKLLNNPAISYPMYTNLVYMDPDCYMPGKHYNALWRRQWQKQYTWDATPYEAEADDYDWIYRFRQIHVYNEIIANVDDAGLGNLPESKRGLIKGEAYAQRAFEYFLLVNEYAPHYSKTTLNEPAIPMPLVVDLQAQLPRSTVGEMYDQILSDLNVAEPLLAGAPVYISNGNFRPGRAAIKALHALVALYMGNFADAKKYSDESLAAYDFMYDFNTITNYTAGNKWSGYSIFDYDYSTDCKEVLWNRYGRWVFYDPAGLYAPHAAALFDKDNDRRWKLHAATKTYFGDDVTPDFAYARWYAENNVGITIPNVVLVNAEAKARTNDATGAVAALNKLRAKRYEAAGRNYVYTTDAALLEEIKNERRRENFGTGITLIDFKRYHAYGESVPTFTRTVNGQTYTLEPGSSKYVAPISTKILNLNPNL